MSAPVCRSPRVSWRDVLRALPEDSERVAAVASLTACGFSADSFATQRRAREAVAECLVRLEDALELQAIDAGGSGRGRRRERLTERRLAIQTLRRRLELELWP